MRTVYLIDSENVADHWVGRIQLKSSLDRIVVFWSRNCKGIAIWLIPEILRLYPAEQLEFIECYTGLNSMDFHIVAKLGQLTARSSKSSFVVVSDDTGYDGVINYLHSTGASVSRLSGLSALRNISHIPEVLTPNPELVTAFKVEDDVPENISTIPQKPDESGKLGKEPEQTQPKDKLFWGVSENGMPWNISAAQKQAIAQKVNQFMQKNPGAMKYRQTITDILATAVYPSKPNAVQVYERLIKVPNVKLNKMASIYRAMKQQLLPALDEILVS